MSNEQMKLQRLCDDLEELLAECKPFGCGLISTDPSTEVTNQTVWGKIARLIPSVTERETVLHEDGPVWLDPFPDRTACLRWFGDAESVALFGKWTDRAGDALVEFGILPNASTMNEIPGQQDGMRVLIGDPLRTKRKSYRLLRQLALSIKREYPEVAHQALLDQSELGTIEQQKQIGVPFIDEKPISFVFLRVPVHGCVVDGFKKLCKLRGGPRLSVDVESKDKTVTLDGECFPLDEEYALILASIISGGGNPISRNTMRKTHPLLSDDEHLERKIHNLRKLCPKVYKLIESEPKKGYFIAKEYLV